MHPSAVPVSLLLIVEPVTGNERERVLKLILSVSQANHAVVGSVWPVDEAHSGTDCDQEYKRSYTSAKHSSKHSPLTTVH